MTALAVGVYVLPLVMDPPLVNAPGLDTNAYDTWLVSDAVTRTLDALYPLGVMPVMVMTDPTGMAVVMAPKVRVAMPPLHDAPVTLIVVAVLLGAIQ
jgi:hypothetical protein